MHDLIRHTLERLRLLLAPGTGRRRRPQHRPRLCLHLTVVRRPSAPLAPPPSAPPPPHLPRHRSPYGLVTSIDGATSPLVRPYLATHEREATLRERRRLALVLAADFGIDLGRHLIGAQEVAA